MSRQTHNSGQTDRSKGRYENPHGLMDQLVSFVSATDEEWTADIKDSQDYDKGWNHTDRQVW